MSATRDRGHAKVRAGERPSGTNRVLVPIAYMALIFGLSSIPATGGADDFEVRRPETWLSSPIQNLLHVPTYGLLAALVWWSLIPRLRSVPLQAGLACVVAGLYGVVDELHQAFVPGRSSSARDMLFNTVGVVAGTCAFGYLLKRRKVRSA